MSKMAALTITAVLAVLAMIYVPYNYIGCNGNGLCINEFTGFGLIFDPSDYTQINFGYLILELIIIAYIGAVLYQFASKE